MSDSNLVIRLTLVSILGGTSTAAAWRSGAPAARNGSVASGGATCRDCHAGADGVGFVEISGVPTGYAPGALYSIGVRVFDPDQLGAGFELSVEDTKGIHAGQLNIIDTQRTSVSPGAPGWVTHTFFGEFESVQQWKSNGTSYEYFVEWRAPSEDIGPVTFFAAGNAVNDNGQPDGDHVYTVAETSFPESDAPCEADANDDGQVNPLDAGFVLARLGCQDKERDIHCESADVNEDGVVDPLDVGLVLAQFGNCPA